MAVRYAFKFTHVVVGRLLLTAVYDRGLYLYSLELLLRGTIQGYWVTGGEDHWKLSGGWLPASARIESSTYSREVIYQP